MCFLYHWKEESQHARIDELEWVRENAGLSAEGRNQAVDDMIALVGAVDGIVCAQAAADVGYFLNVKGAALSEQKVKLLQDQVLRAYRWQYILSGVEERRFQRVLRAMITGEQMGRIEAALAPLIASAGPNASGSEKSCRRRSNDERTCYESEQSTMGKGAISPRLPPLCANPVRQSWNPSRSSLRCRPWISAVETALRRCRWRVSGQKLPGSTSPGISLRPGTNGRRSRASDN